jgi:hypothetical protein
MHSACADSPAMRARTAAHAPRKQGGRQPLWPARMVAHAHFSEASSLVQVPGRTRSKNGAPPIPFPRTRRGFQAEPLRLLANYRPAGKRSTILIERA